MTPEDEQDELGGITVLTQKRSDAYETVTPGTLQLVVVGVGRFATHAVPDGEVVAIGRSSGCDIVIDHKSISRRHALLTLGDRITIEDLDSANGTEVRGAKLKPQTSVEISVGESFRLGSVSILLQQRSCEVRTRRIWTHDYFETRLEEECKRVERSGTPFTVVRIDVSRDADESFVEETLGEVVRESDILGKYGPYQYEVLMPEISAERADSIMQRIDGELRARGLACKLVASCCPRDGRSPYQLGAYANVEESSEAGSDIVVKDPQMQSLYVLIEQVAVSNISVLLLGETGVGKEVFAQAVHRGSQRADGPFVAINCGALTDTLLESELFGHEKGAFTSAQNAKPGLLETADGGTVFLDEIGEMPLNTQVKLLRIIENSQLRRVGGVKARSIDVRFLAATNVDLDAQVAAGRFRRDLFYRLNSVTIAIPPLRERLGELEPMARAFIARAVVATKMPVPALTAGALELMKSYAWPGNVRELKNMMERAVLLSRGGPIGPEHLPAEKMRTTVVTNRPTRPVSSQPRTRPATNQPPSEPPVEDAPLARGPRKGSPEEQQWILQALESTGGNQTLAARLLGISRRTLVSRLSDYQLERPRKKN